MAQVRLKAATLLGGRPIFATKSLKPLNPPPPPFLLGTIVGSAVFNLTCIIGGTAIFATKPLELDWRPLTRDSFVYGN
jgi:hypothetical protein